MYSSVSVFFVFSFCDPNFLECVERSENGPTENIAKLSACTIATGCDRYQPRVTLELALEKGKQL